MADRRRRRRRASQDSEEEEEESGSESPGSEEKPVLPGKSETREVVVPVRVREGDKSECESEDGIGDGDGDAVLSDYESAEESEEEEPHLSEEEALKATLKPENTAVETTAAATTPDAAPTTIAVAPTATTPKEEKLKTKGAVTGERQSGDGQESIEPDENKVSPKTQKQLDDDEDRKNPAYIPRKGLFFEHDLRGHTNDEEVRPKGRHPRKLWKDEGRWVHDRFREDEQAPKSRDELIAMYGYDIRSSKNPEEIHTRRPRKPRYPSPSRREDQEEMPIRQSNRYYDSESVPPPRTYNSRNSPGNNRPVTNRTYSRPGGYKENRPVGYPPDDIVSPPPTSERRQDYGGYRARSIEHAPQPPDEEPPEMSIPNKVELTNEKPADPSPPPPDRPVEKKSYSRARRSRAKVGEAGKSIDDTTFPELPPPPPPQMPTEVVPEPSPPIPVVKPGGWEPPVEGGLAGLEQDMSQVNIADQNWTPGQSPYVSTRIQNHIHMPGAPPQYGRMEGMGVQSGRVKRYSSQRQRPVPDPAPAPMHISLMEGHYYDPLQYQGPIYAHTDGSSPLPPQGMIVQQEMHLPHPGLHPHQSPAPMTTPSLYPAPVSIPPGQPPPQQLLPPPYFTAPPGVINFGNPAYPYPPGALPPPPPPHLYPNTQAQSQVYGGVTYYNPVVQQQVQPKPSPPRRTSQPVTIKPPPPERHQEYCRTDYCQSAAQWHTL
ncbi:protein CASC3 isoform X2 [Rana temporaria]|uniref:protein CASC3 isoform X2 n=1 Tax=Rana temporaria TaxID=8407 RepID=UPI001AAD2F73|nr:protein CASC3 isoform X2 [Rana temporaria]